MAEPNKSTDEKPQEPSKSSLGIVIWLAVGLASAAAGAAVPLLLVSEPEQPAEDPSQQREYELLEADKVMFLPFGDVTVNLNEGRMNRYLRIKISLQIDRTQEQVVADALAKQGLIARNWLISYLSDKELDAIRGAAGQNMLRREIRDEFNTVLFSDGYDRIFDVLFEEFNVQ